MDNKDIEDAANKGAEKLRTLRPDIPKALRELWEDIKTMISMLRDYVTGEYREVPWHVISGIAAAVAYFACPVDVIPDVVPGLGYVDDALVITLALDVARMDIRKYRKWRESNAGTA